MAEYFRSPHGFWWVLIPSAVTINFLAWYNPHVLETPLLPWIGPLASHVGSHYHHITTYTNIFAIVAHVGEALYAYYLCHKNAIGSASTAKWVLQTFVLGFPSLRMLLKYSANQQKKRKL